MEAKLIDEFEEARGSKNGSELRLINNDFLFKFVNSKA
jgi:hypothetical protein